MERRPKKPLVHLHSPGLFIFPPPLFVVFCFILLNYIIVVIVDRQRFSKDLSKLFYEYYRNIPPELQGVSVKDMVRVMGESRANGNASPSSSPVPVRKSGAVAIANRSLSAHSSPGITRPVGSPPFTGKFWNWIEYTLIIDVNLCKI